MLILLFCICFYQFLANKDFHTIISFGAPSRAGDNVSIICSTRSSVTWTHRSLLARRLELAVRRQSYRHLTHWNTHTFHVQIFIN